MIYVFIFITGVCLGSFYACIGYRIPNKISIVKPSSFCPNCKNSLKWYMNIPLLSYIFLKGKCRYCSKHISIKYPLFELLTGILFVLSYVKFGFTINAIVSIIFCSMLVIITISDLSSYIIPDSVLLICFILIFIIYLFTYKTFAFDHLINGIISFGFMYAVKLIGNLVFKRESMGDGDIKLMGVVGMIIGYKKVIISLFLASYLGLPYAIYVMVKKNVNHELPFGPFLALASLILFCIDFKIF